MASQPYELNWKKLDPEARFGFPAKRFTGVGNISSALLGVFFTGMFYLVLYSFWQLNRWQMVNMFFHGGPENRSTIPYYTMFLTMWQTGLQLNSVLTMTAATIPMKNDFSGNPATNIYRPASLGQV